jgi:hypothetical protein
MERLERWSSLHTGTDSGGHTRHAGCHSASTSQGTKITKPIGRTRETRVFRAYSKVLREGLFYEIITDSLADYGKNFKKYLLWTIPRSLDLMS